MKQSRTPLIDALRAFHARNRAYFNIPGHRGGVGADERLLDLLGSAALEADRTETDGLDDLHAPEGAIREAQELAADLFGSDRCWFLVNGTTCANEAMLLSVLRPGEKVLVPRNAHKSVLMGLIQSGAVPVWMMPELETSGDVSLYGRILPQTVEQALDADPEIRAAFLVSPTYYGSCSDVGTIAGIAHRHGIPLLVDEAHGAHFYFHEAFPQGAVAAGADLVAQSTHKTLGSLTQSAMLHGSGVLVSFQRVSDALKIVQSTSPSYLLMASLDGTRHLMAAEGRLLQEHAMRMADLLRTELRTIPGIRVLHEQVGAEGRRAHLSLGLTPYTDPCRVVFSPLEAGLGGTQLQARLFEQGITTELADPEVVVLVVTHANTEEEIHRFCHGVREAVRKEMNLRRESLAENGHEQESIRIAPVIKMSPRDAFFSDKEVVSLKAAAGRIAAEAVTPYPPGIPLVCPGELLTEAVCRQLQVCRDQHIPVHDAADPSLETIRVIEVL